MGHDGLEDVFLFCHYFPDSYIPLWLPAEMRGAEGLLLEVLKKE